MLVRYLISALRICHVQFSVFIKIPKGYVTFCVPLTQRYVLL